MNFPLPIHLAWRTAGAVLFRRRLSFRDQAVLEIARLKLPLVVLGKENIPQAGPAVITMNHYTHPGFPAYWMALAISALVPADICWIMAAAWTDRRWWKGAWWSALTQVVFKEIARVFGFMTMPPMPPDPAQAAWRAQSVRRVLRFIRDSRDDGGRGSAGTPTALIGLAPEGGDTKDGVLSMPPPGSGRFIRQMIHMGLVIVPAGVFIDRCGLVVCFGPSYRLEIDESASRVDQDRAIARHVMTQIARLLPGALRGEFDENELEL